MAPLESSVQDKGTNAGLKTASGYCLSAITCPSALSVARGWQAVECMPGPELHRGQHLINTQQPSKHLVHLLFPGFALLDNRGSVLGREVYSSVSRNNCSSVSCGRFLAPSRAVFMDRKGHFSPKSMVAFCIVWSFAFDFIEVEDYLIAMKWERLNKTIVSQSKLLRLSEERGWFFNLHTIPAILRRPTSL